MTTARPLISIAGATVEFQRGNISRPALMPLDLEVQQGEFIAMVGPSGCGKSTVLNMVAGFVHPTVGSVSFAGREVAKVNTDVGYMTQADALLPWRTTEENITLPLTIRGHSRNVASHRTAEILEAVGLADYGRHYPKELSGGMRKRAALAQVLAYEPSTILMDEPFGALDAHLRLLMQQEVTRIFESRGISVLLVTHDIDEALALADRILIFGGYPGRIIREIRPGFARPRDVLGVRRDPLFREMFDQVWNELVPALKAEERELADA